MSRRIAVTVCLILVGAPAARAGLLSVPAGYRAEKSWPVVVSYQDNPSPALMKETDYFLVHAGGKGTTATSKTRDYLKGLAKRYNIDPFRIYGTGFSRGGHELLAQAWQHPHWFAAIAPVCNDLRREPKVRNVKYLLHTPTLLLHGDGDSFRVTGKRLFGLMKEAGCTVTYTTYPGGHSPKKPFKQDVTLLTDFFDKHRLDPYPKEVVHLVEHKRYSRAFWVDSKLIKDAGGMQATFRVRVGKGNRIEVAANEQIASLELHLTDKLVDMARPVTVFARGKTLYQGPAKAKVIVKLREAKPYYQRPRKPLWEEILEIRAKAAPPASKPARGRR